MAQTPSQKKRKPSPSKSTKKSLSRAVNTPSSRLANRAKQLLHRRSSYLQRRPHRSFHRTYRRDYVRALELPGYLAFTKSVFRHILMHKRIFIISTFVFSLITAVLVGVASQEVYSESIDILKQTSSSLFTGGWGELGKGALLPASVASGTFDNEHTDAQQIYAFLVFMLLWLSTVWILRAQLAGNSPKFRDSLYNSSAPLVSTMLVALLLLVQLVPAAIALVVYQVAGASLTGILAMIVFVIIVLLLILSLYWITSTFIAMIVVTLPGMYPFRAIRIAGDLVVGRRIRILSRLVWGLICTALLWIGIMVPVVLITLWLQTSFAQIASIPVVPTFLVLTSSIASIFIATYCYMLYRKIVDDDASPA